MKPHPLLLSAACLLLGAATPAQDAERPNIAIVGASLSKGLVLKSFVALMGNDPREFAEQRLGRPLTDLEFEIRTGSSGLKAPLARLLGDEAVVRDYSDLYFFREPLEKGRTQLERATRRCDLLVGLDFPFWFGYGGIGGMDADEVAEKRYALQAQGLAMLEELVVDRGARIVVGDYPDMSGADPMMLHPLWVPAPEVLAELNRRLCAWAEEHEGVQVYPLSERMQQARSGEFVVSLRDDDRRLDIDHLLQLDGLHPTKFGIAAILADAVGWIRGRDARFALVMPETTFEEVAKALRLVEPVAVLEELEEAGAAAPVESGAVPGADGDK